jgi:hypothetical protein
MYVRPLMTKAKLPYFLATQLLLTNAPIGTKILSRCQKCNARLVIKPNVLLRSQQGLSPVHCLRPLKRSTSAESALTVCSDGSSQPQKSRNLNGDDVVTSTHRSASAQYNAKIMPTKVVLVRHGQSMGNINPWEISMKICTPQHPITPCP